MQQRTPEENETKLQLSFRLTSIECVCVPVALVFRLTAHRRYLDF